MSFLSWNGISDGLSDYQNIIFVAVLYMFLVSGLKRIANMERAKKIPTSNKRPLKTLEEIKPYVLWNTAMFFPDYHASEPDSTSQQFLWYFQQARISIRVCIYNFSLPELEHVIAKQFERGLIVQFVLGQDASAEKLRRHSIPCGVLHRDSSVPSTDQLMHHKFALIDDEAVLTGSMNWTTEGIVNNKENICVSTNETHVKIYKEEFFRLMSKCIATKKFY